MRRGTDPTVAAIAISGSFESFAWSVGCISVLEGALITALHCDGYDKAARLESGMRYDAG